MNWIAPFDKGKHFTRKGSCMYEYNKLDITPAGTTSIRTA